jgi:hypothetical protein
MLIYSRVTPFGFIDPTTATDEDNFYGEEVSLEGSNYDEEAVLAQAERLRALLAESSSVQTMGFDSQSQAFEMANLLQALADNG